MGDSDPKDSKHKGIKLFTRILNIVTALTLVGFGIAGIIYMALKQLLAFRFFLVFSPIFMVLFGLMLLAADFKIKIVVKHFSFLNTFLGRGVFNFYLSSAVFFYFSCGDNNDVVAWIAAIVIFVQGVIYCVMHCCCGIPQEEGQQKQTKQQMM